MNNTNFSSYKQPGRGFVKRIMEGSLEQIDYVPGSHMRIWYNCQTESYALHHHAAMEVIVCEKEPYHVLIEDHEYVLEEGDILFIPCHMMHRVEAHRSGSRFVCLFNISFLNSFQDLKTIEPVFLKPYLCSFKNQPQIYPKIHDAFMQMFEIYFSNHILWEISIYSLLLQVFSTIGEYYFYTRTPGTDPSNEEKGINFEKYSDLLHYIDSHYAENLTLEQVSAYMGFSKFYFSRLFKQYVGCTFYNYLSRKRIAAAQVLLSTDMSVTDIAFQSGFNNLTSFCRCFKTHTGYSPSEYRTHLQPEDT
jgi:AraC-like DNA-binding protein